MSTADPSDRAWNAPVSGFGVDTVSLRGRTTDQLMRELPERRYVDMCDDVTGVLTEDQRGGNAALRVGDGLVQVYADKRTGVPEVRLTFSAPAILHGHNRDPLPLALLPDVAEIVWEEVSSAFTGMPDFEGLRLTRLDLARDFSAVPGIPDLLLAVSRLPVRRARTDRLERGANGAWQSLTRGNSRRWLAVAYDKSREMMEKASRTQDPDLARLLRKVAAESQGRLRWELQIRRPVLLDESIMSTVVDHEEMFAMSESYFDRTRFGDVLGGVGRVTRALDSLTPAEERGVLSVLISDLLGRQPPYSHNPADGYRQLARRLSLSPADLVSPDAEPRRLDFVSGTHSVGDAAIASALEESTAG